MRVAISAGPPPEFCAITLPFVLSFASARTATASVAGLPAVARAVHALAEAGATDCPIWVGEPWQPDAATAAEIARLGGRMSVELLQMPAADDVARLPGEDIVAAGTRAPALARSLIEPGVQAAPPTPRTETDALAAYAYAADQIVTATAKPGDGVVSRHINRRISQAVSRRLLARYPAIRPDQATIGTALLAVAMVAVFVFGGKPGLIAGALLFQAASIFDGVDGEIARATFRTSPRGAMLDSITDALTNVGFVGGVAINLYRGGDSHSAVIGGIGVALFLIGITLIGRRARGGQQPFTFNGVKDDVRARGSTVMTWLTWLTSRDSFALILATLIVAGLAPQALALFAIFAAGWLVVVVFVLARQAA